MYMRIPFLLFILFLFLTPYTLFAVEPNVVATEFFPIGMFEDQNIVGTDTTYYTELIDYTKAMNMDTILFTNGNNANQSSLL